MVSKIEAANFLSWENLTFSVVNGVTLIDGWNNDDQTSEGSGKSAILNALSWCLYGKIPKDANIDDVIKTGRKGCGVIVTLDDGTQVVRSRRPNDLYILTDKKVKGKDARETQKIIEEYVGLSFEAFCQTVYFAQNYDKKFITSNQEDKGKILSEVQDLQVFDKARKETMALIKNSEKAAVDLDHQLSMLHKDLQLIEKDFENEHALYQQREAQREQRRKIVQDEIGKLARLVGELERNGAEYEKQKEKLLDKCELIEKSFVAETDKLRLRGQEIQAQLDNFEKKTKQRADQEALGKKYAQRYQQLSLTLEKAQDFINNPTKDCPTCGTTLTGCDTTHAAKEVEDTKSEMTQLMGFMQDISAQLSEPWPAVDQLKAELVDVSEEVHVRETRLIEQQTNLNNFNRLEETIKHLYFTVNQHRQRQDELQAQADAINAEMVQHDDEKLKALDKQKKELLQKIEVVGDVFLQKKLYLSRLETLKSGFKEVKSHVFNSLLNEINARANQYASRLFEVPVSIQFVNDNMKIQTKITLNGEPRGLGLLSGGQFRRMSLATDLALSDIISARKNAKLGLLILDEYFKDLSESSMEKCLELLQQRKQPVILIEHNSIFKNIIDNTFFVKLDKGTSHVET